MGPSTSIHVGKLAGLPKTVTARAEEVLAVLEKGEQGGALARLADELTRARCSTSSTG
jgi:DNA mismatch repair protein MutS